MPTATEPAVSPEPGVSSEPTADADGVPAPDGPGSPPRRWDPVRVVCHLAAELPFVILCVRSMATGWRATSDDAVIAWRAWDVLSAHPTLLGAPTHTAGLGHQAFAPGPVLSWLVAVPVHLDPAQGALWGSTIVAVAAAALAVEAGRAAGGRWGAVGASAAVLVVATTQTAVLMNPVWTPWQGALWLVTALMGAWATATGRWRWWPVCVAAASIAAQAHVVFALTAASVCVVSPLVGWSTVRRHPKSQTTGPGVPARAPAARRATWPLVTGAAVGAVLWLPPLIDQVAGTPGNVTLLWRSSEGAGGHVGYTRALQGLGAATWPIPSWAHRLPLPTSGPREFLSIAGTTFHGPAWRGVATLVVLAVLGWWCTVTRRHVVAALSWVALVGGLAAVVTIARTPAADAFELVYLGVLFWSVGTVTVGALVAGLVAVVRGLAGDRSRLPTTRRITAPAMVVALVALIALSVGVTVVDARSVPNVVSVQDGPTVGVLADRAAAAVAGVAPDRPFLLLLGGTSAPDRSSAVYPAIAYDLVTRGLPVRLPAADAVGADASRASRGGEPTVTVDIGTLHPTARVAPPRRGA